MGGGGNRGRPLGFSLSNPRWMVGHLDGGEGEAGLGVVIKNAGFRHVEFEN